MHLVCGSEYTAVDPTGLDVFPLATAEVEGLAWS